MCVERMEGVLIMAANTKALPKMDMSTCVRLRTQFIMIDRFGSRFSYLHFLYDDLSIHCCVCLYLGTHRCQIELFVDTFFYTLL